MFKCFSCAISYLTLNWIHVTLKGNWSSLRLLTSVFYWFRQCFFRSKVKCFMSALQIICFSPFTLIDFYCKTDQIQNENSNQKNLPSIKSSMVTINFNKIGFKYVLRFTFFSAIWNHVNYGYLLTASKIYWYCLNYLWIVYDVTS